MADSAIPPLITFLAWIGRHVKGARDDVMTYNKFRKLIS